MLSQLKENLSGKRSEHIEKELADTKNIQLVHSEKIAEMQSDLNSVKGYFTELIEQQKQLHKENAAALESSAQLKQQLDDSMSSVKVISSTIQNSLVKKIKEDLSNLMQEVSDKLSGSERLKKEIEAAASAVKEELNSLKSEISRLQKVTAGIKAQDFELTKFQGQMKAADSEKLKLMRQIDSLQRLVSSLRRKMN